MSVDKAQLRVTCPHRTNGRCRECAQDAARAADRAFRTNVRRVLKRAPKPKGWAA